MSKRFTVVVEESLYAEEVEAGTMMAGEGSHRAVASHARTAQVGTDLFGKAENGCLDRLDFTEAGKLAKKSQTPV